VCACVRICTHTVRTFRASSTPSKSHVISVNSLYRASGCVPSQTTSNACRYRYIHTYRHISVYSCTRGMHAYVRNDGKIYCMHQIGNEKMMYIIASFLHTKSCTHIRGGSDHSNGMCPFALNIYAPCGGVYTNMRLFAHEPACFLRVRCFARERIPHEAIQVTMMCPTIHTCK